MLMGFGATSAMADAILFPYINSNPGNVSTIVNVINTLGANPGAGICAVGQTMQLHYWYFTKLTSASATDPCEENDFDRPTTVADIVSFDCGANIGGGNALFNDTTDYTLAGSTRFDCPFWQSADPRRGYMLVNHICTGGGVGDADFFNGFGGLDGEAMLVDIVNGAAYSYRAVTSNPVLLGASGGFPGALPFAFSPSNAIVPLNPGMTPAAGMTTDLLAEPPAAVGVPILAPNLSFTRNEMVAIYPPDELTTRFFVTPLFMASTVGNPLPANFANMSLQGNFQQKRANLRLVDRNGTIGIVGRDEDRMSASGNQNVRCVAGIEQSTLTGNPGNWPATGGWAALDLINPTGLDLAADGALIDGDYNAIVLKLEFGAPTWANGQMINGGVVVRSGRIWP